MGNGDVLARRGNGAQQRRRDDQSAVIAGVVRIVQGWIPRGRSRWRRTGCRPDCDDVAQRPTRGHCSWVLRGKGNCRHRPGICCQSPRGNASSLTARATPHHHRPCCCTRLEGQRQRSWSMSGSKSWECMFAARLVTKRPFRTTTLQPKRVEPRTAPHRS